MENSQTANGCILRPEAAAAFLGISRPSLYRWERDNPDFPRRIKLGERVSGWKRADLEAWINARAQAGKGGAA